MQTHKPHGTHTYTHAHAQDAAAARARQRLRPARQNSGRRGEDGAHGAAETEFRLCRMIR
eukprot:4730536-Pleurochrysis_carterae.AAC.6